MDDCHALYLWQDILQAIIVYCVETAHTQYEADCLDSQSVIDDSHELLCKPDMLQFKELCYNNYMLCEDEYDLYKEWTQVIEARPRYINISTVGLQTKMSKHRTMTKIDLMIIWTTIAGRHFSSCITRCWPIISGSPIAQRRQPCFEILK
jgi:hypothetical protein